jgi:CRISPR-associated protein Cmr6
MIAPVPKGLRPLLAQNTHPGLLLDKYVPSWEEGAAPGKLSERVQKPAVRAVAALSQAPPPDLDWDDLMRRRQALLGAAGAITTPCVTAGPLTLHLARASALENAGICLHPVYGFAYLPGSGLKGLARAYAVTADRAAAREDILAVFGNEPGEPDADKQTAGAIIFHDAWPLAWPWLVEDLVNNHHSAYYGAPSGDNENPPGDWEEPRMVSFLAVPAGVPFDFPLGKRRGDVEDRLLNLARGWLLGGLTQLGAGAKTAAGYGSFRPSAGTAQPLPATTLEMFEATLELVTPAFLAGPSQDQADCDLRPSVLRGLLRWWWRAFHAGFVDVATLRRMEAAVWGDTEHGGAVRVTVEPIPGGPKPERCPFKKLDKDNRGRDVLQFDDAFLRRQKLRAAPKRTTQGLAYAAYGMDEMPAGKRDQRKPRWYAPAGSRWRVRLTARLSSFDGRALSARLLLDQARLALWWFCHLGGAGSKARKGFGSFADPPELRGFEGVRWLTQCRPFRAACGVPEDDFQAERVASPSLGQMRNLASSLGMNPCLEIATPWTNPWRVLDEIGAAMQAFAQSPPESGHGKHCDAKRHLGLPRKLHGPLPFALPHQRDWSPPIDLEAAHGDRHAAPIWYHVAPGERGLTIRVSPFPSADTRAPDTDATGGWQKSQQILGELLRHLQAHLTTRAAAND